MSWLADLPEIVGFFSYSREDDDAFEGTLSALRDAIQRELAAQLGRSKANFRLWQDRAAIAPGKLWESEIETAVGEAVFFIPIVTPRAVNSRYCKFEFEAFLAREHALGRTDLVFPLLYMRVPALENEAQWRQDPVLSIIGIRQYVDWRPFRHLDVRTTTVGEAIERFCDKILEALREPWVSPEERRKQWEIEAQRRKDQDRQAEKEKRRAEAAPPAEEEKRRAEEEMRWAEAPPQAEDEQRRKRPAPRDENPTQSSRLRYRVRSFVDELKNQTENVKDSSELLHIFRRKLLDAVILRDELNDCGAESTLPRFVYLHPQNKHDISDILDELEHMARRL